MSTVKWIAVLAGAGAAVYLLSPKVRTALNSKVGGIKQKSPSSGYSGWYEDGRAAIGGLWTSITDRLEEYRNSGRATATPSGGACGEGTVVAQGGGCVAVLS